MGARAGSAVGLAIALAVWSLLPGGGVAPVAAQGVPVGTAQNAVGTLVVVRTDGIEHRLQGRGALTLFEGDVLRTEAGSQALIQLRPGIPVALNERTTLKILSRWEKAGTMRILRVSRGGVWAKAGDGARQLEIETPAAVAAARDAEIDLKVTDAGQSALTVVQGTVELGTPFGVCSVRAGTASVGARGTACTAPQPANATAAVSWKQAVTQ
ncbi:MAG TPA: FecR family protein [Candidatus Deferrimicrobiaceae bacterium]|nr:FecR family protein [Candidatus Deferrimicrobiaceae bacterium]